MPNNFSVDLPVLMDTGVDEMLLWLSPADRPLGSTNASKAPTGVAVTITAPAAPNAPVLHYSFVTGDATNPTPHQPSNGERHGNWTPGDTFSPRRITFTTQPAEWSVSGARRQIDRRRYPPNGSTGRTPRRQFVT